MTSDSERSKKGNLGARQVSVTPQGLPGSQLGVVPLSKVAVTPTNVGSPGPSVSPGTGPTVQPLLQGGGSSQLGVISEAQVPGCEIRPARQSRGIGVVQAAIFREKAPPDSVPLQEEQLIDGVAIVGKFGGGHEAGPPPEACLADAMETFGKKVVRIDRDSSYGQPPPTRWVVCTAHPNSYERIFVWQGGRRTVFWTTEWLLDGADRAGALEAAKRASIFGSADSHDWATTHGMSNHVRIPAACESVWPMFDPRPSLPCLFLGATDNPRGAEIAEIVRTLGGRAAEPGELKLRSHGLARLVQDVKVVVVDNPQNNIPSYWSTRNYTVPGAGGFLLTPEVEGLDCEFGIGQHVGVYGPIDGLRSRLEFWISCDVDREIARRAAFIHVRQNHNWRGRAKALLLSMDRALTCA